MSHIYGSLGSKAKRVAICSLPVYQFFEKRFYRTLVTNKVVIHKENSSTPPQFKKKIQLGLYLTERFGSGLSAIKNDDVAKLTARKGTLWNTVWPLESKHPTATSHIGAPGSKLHLAYL